MTFKVLLIERIPVEDVSVAITTKFKSFEKRMMGGNMPFLDKDGYHTYYVTTMVSQTEDAKLLIYVERDDIEDAGNAYLSQALDNLKMLCDMNEYPCTLYTSPMEHKVAIAAIKDIHRVFPSEVIAVASAFGFSDAECDNIEAELNGAAKVDNSVADIPTDTEFVISGSTSDNEQEHEASQMEAYTEGIDDTATISKGIDLDELANKIAARINAKNPAPVTSEREIISSSNILKTQTETLEEWAIRVYLSGADVESDVEQIHSKIKGLLIKSLSYVCKATESSVVKKEVATSTTPEVKEVETKDTEEKIDDLDEKVEETEKTIYSENDEAEEESTESVGNSETDIMMQVARESSSDAEFFIGIRKYKDELSHEALDNIAKYNMFNKLIFGTNEENSFVTYTKRKTVLGI